ncbi:MAG TPA: Uma2 family endonuclease [Gemmataceae bacterium]|nr:Uma2 family endonuclease [Gemmataceae bacterium]
MAAARKAPAPEDLDYPTTDGRPMAETDWHRDLMVALIQALQLFYAAARRVYVSGNLLIFYEPGNRRRHVSPDVFVVKGVAKRQRPNYLVWREGKGPDLVIELTSQSTRDEDVKDKFELYRDVLRVREYFLFDPFQDFLDPPLQGYRLRKGEYVPIKPLNGRLPSAVLGLHLERDGQQLRLYDPKTGRWLPTPQELAEQEAEARRHAERARQEEAEARRRAEAEVERLRRELDELRRRAGG